jgi:phage gp29-like protein
MRGALGAITPWWIGRNYALRDWMRHSEVFGLPMFKVMTPAVGDPVQQAIIAAQLRTIGQSAVFHLPQNPPPALSYDVELLEAKTPGENIFRMLIAQCNEEITLAINGQTLTTSMPAEGGSSYAAARVHAGVLQGILEADARALALTVYQQLARPFAAINFGDPNLAPWVVWDVTPFEDAKTKALAFMQIAEALNFMRVAGFKLKARDVRKMIRDTIPGFDVGPIDSVDPLQIQAAEAKADDRKGRATGDGRRDHHGSGDARARIANLMARIDPRVMQSKRVDDDAEALREATAAIEAAHADAEASARKRNVLALNEEIGDLFGRWG